MKRLAGILLASALLLAACGGTGGSYTLGGTVSGLRGTLVLANDSDRVTITQNGPFAFPQKQPNGARYRVTIETPPLFENCTVANGEGTVRGADVRDVAVTCEDKAWQGPEGLEPDLAGDAIRVRTAFAGERQLVAWEEQQKIYLTTGGEGGWSDPELVAQNDADSLGLAGNPSGFAAMAWTAKKGGTQQVFAKTYAGGHWSGTRWLSDGREAHLPSLAVNDAQGAVLTWQENDGQNTRIRVAFFDGGGWSTPAYVSEAGQDAEHPAAAVNNHGDALVAWLQRGDVYAALYENGQWRSPERLPGNSLSNENVHVFLDDAGRGYAVWEVSNPGGSRLALAVYRVGAWARDDIGTSGARAPVIAGSRSEGTVTIAWLAAEGGAARVWAKVFENGKWLGPEVLSPPGGTGNNAEAVFVAADPAGNALAVWLQKDGSHRRQVFAAFRQYGLWRKPADLDDFLSRPGYAVRPPVSRGGPSAALGQGRALAAWSQDDGGCCTRTFASVYR